MLNFKLKIRSERITCYQTAEARREALNSQYFIDAVYIDEQENGKTIYSYITAEVLHQQNINRREQWNREHQPEAYHNSGYYIDFLCYEADGETITGQSPEQREQMKQPKQYKIYYNSFNNEDGYNTYFYFNNRKININEVIRYNTPWTEKFCETKTAEEVENEIRADKTNREYNKMYNLKSEH